MDHKTFTQLKLRGYIKHPEFMKYVNITNIKNKNAKYVILKRKI